ncbi:YibE/F family protein [Patescibacteria group bacterium]|nr:YibE/F family protein [Patescibacteria group bacterium]
MKKLIITISLLMIFFPVLLFAQEPAESSDQPIADEQVFEAKAVQILEEKTIEREDGSTEIQQNVKLRGTKGEWKDKEVIYYGIGDIDVFQKTSVKKGDKVIVSASSLPDGEMAFYIIDYVRTGYIYFLAALFALLTAWVGRGKGIKSILSLIITFLIIMLGIIPFILKGYSPLLVSIVGSTIILASIIYLTWGWTKKSHVAMFSIVLSLFITSIISIIFSFLTKLSGTASEEVLFLMGQIDFSINFQGLLLAGIILGTLGVLDDVVISQISTVEELRSANDKLTTYELYKKGLNVGVDHISSMTNTLFLAYAGASLPLLLLFTTNENSSFGQIVNNEMIATEIVRTLAGSIGLILAVPIATVLAARYLKNKN